MRDTYFAKMMRGEDFTADLKSDWGPETEMGRPVSLEIRVDLSHKKGKPDYCLSISGKLTIKECAKLGLHAVRVACQCTDVDEILARNGLWCHHIDVIVGIWKKWHLNDMNAGTDAQEDFLEEYRKNHPDWKYDYNEACLLLKGRGLYFDKSCIVDGMPYEYGNGLVFRRIPKDVLVELCGALDGGLVIVPKGEGK